MSQALTMVSLTVSLASRWPVSAFSHRMHRPFLARSLISWPKFDSAGGHFIYHSVAVTTRRTYSSGERQFIRFCLHHGLVSPRTPLLPSSEATLIHFVTHLSNTVSHATIKVYLAAVKNLHIEFGCQLDFTSMPLLYKTLRGIKCSQTVSKRARYPITITVLHLIYSKLQPFHTQAVMGCLYAGLFRFPTKQWIHLQWQVWPPYSLIQSRYQPWT